MKDILLGIMVVIGILLFLCAGHAVSIYNTHIDLQTQIEAKQEANEANFDTMWKKIRQVSNVSENYKNDLKEILIVYTDGRKDVSKDMLMKWGNEAVPNFDASMYKQVNNVIVASRDEFYKNQQILLDLNRQHDQFIKRFPNNIYCKILGIKHIDITTVTSTKTQAVFSTGLEDEVEL